MKHTWYDTWQALFFSPLYLRGCVGICLLINIDYLMTYYQHAGRLTMRFFTYVRCCICIQLINRTNSFLLFTDIWQFAK